MTELKRSTAKDMTAAELAELRRRHLRVALACGAFVAGMVGMSFAAVPFYNWFCRTTGFDGTPLIARAAPAHAIARKVTVRFDANTGPGLPWSFSPMQRDAEIKVGETLLVHYVAQNTGAQETVGTATYNVSPAVAAAYFNKLECFCFTEQRLEAGERAEFPVVFFIDPAIEQDRELAGIREVTLSYTFFPVRKKPEPVAAISGQEVR